MWSLSFHMLNLSSCLILRKAGCILYIYNQVLTLQKTHHFSTTRTKRLLLLLEIIDVYSWKSYINSHVYMKRTCTQWAKCEAEPEFSIKYLEKFQGTLCLLRRLRLSQRFSWRSSSSGTLKQVEVWIVADVSKVCVSFTFGVKQSRNSEPRIVFSFGRRFANFGVVYKWRGPG
jgi:hypothetical protein